jgi:hypothetical protein
MIEQTAVQRPGFSRIAAFKKCGRFDATVEYIWFLAAAERNLPDVL